MKKKPITDFLSSGFSLLVAGFLLTTVCGTFINSRFSQATWKREKDFELLKAKLAQHDELLSDLTKVIGARVFRLQRVVWLMDPTPETPDAAETWEFKDGDQKDDTKNEDATKGDGKKEDYKTLQGRWDKYYETVADWNVNYRTYAIKIRVLAGSKMADQFIARDDISGARKAKSGTLCGVIEETHKIVADLKKKVDATSRVNRTEHENAQCEVDHLYDAVDNFVRQLYEALGDRARSDDPVATSSASPVSTNSMSPAR